jgi:GT2 family glycosyltransferase
MADVSVVVVTYNALPWLERCLESVRPYETIVVDHGSTDGTLELVRRRFPQARLIEEGNTGLGAGSNTGMRLATGDYFLLLNSDAWAVGDAVDRLVAFAGERPEAAVVGPKLLNPDGTLQRSVRGFPTLWRLTTEYFFLRKLAPRSRALNAFYASRFAHDEVHEAEFLMGSCLLVRRQAADTVGLFDEDFFMFSEETDWCYRFVQAGWKVLFFPGAEFVHVGGATTSQNWGPMYREQLRGHLRFLAKHRGPREAERARRLLLASMRLRSLIFRGERRRTSREAARWLASARAGELLT